MSSSVLHRFKTKRLALWATVLAAAALVFAALGAPQAAQASHFRADQITWHTGANPGDVDFELTVSVRASYFSITAVGDTFQEGAVDLGDGASEMPQFTVTALDSANDVATADASFTHTYTGTGPFSVQYDNCCRLSAPSHINNPDGEVILVSTIDLSAATGSPVSLISPIIDCAPSAVCSFSIPAIKADPASTLTYRMATADESGIVNQPGAPYATNAASISSTGTYTWDSTGATLNPGLASDPTAPTFYSTQIVIEEVLNGVTIASTPVDFFIRLTGGTGNAAPAFDGGTPADGTSSNIPMGQVFSFPVSATDPDTGDTVSLSILGLPQGATFTPTAGNPATGTFSWTPGTVGQQVILVLQAQDQHGLQAVQRSVTLTVKDVGNLAPQFDGGTPADGATFDVPAGEAFSFPVSATDPNSGDIVTLSVDGMPQAATFVPTPGNPATGTFSWTPGTAGQQIVLVLHAQDQHALGAAPRTITLNVTPAPSPSPSPSTPSHTPTHPHESTGGLATTGGADMTPIVGIAVVLLVLGGAAALVGARHRRRPTH